MAGFHCVDCIFCKVSFNDKYQQYQASCSRGYTLADPHITTDPERFFATDPSRLVPVVDPYGKEYLRTKNVCDRFTRPEDNDADTSKHRRRHLF